MPSTTLPNPPRQPDYYATARTNGYLPIEAYGVLGDGRTVAASGADGSIDWWCVPNMDSPPLFDRLLDSEKGGFFSITPVEPYRVQRRYRPDSNVLETEFHTASGRARLVESLNSGKAGRLPWEELGRRVEGLDGSVLFKVRFQPGRQADMASPYIAKCAGHNVFHVGHTLGICLFDDALQVTQHDDEGLSGHIHIQAGQCTTLAVVAGCDEPLVVPSLKAIDGRIDLSDEEWKRWAADIEFDHPQRPLLIRHALALKLLLYSPTGAIAAAGTTSVPEAIGGDKNYDYRYAWVRDAGYTIKAFLRIGAQAEAKAALTWLLQRVRETDGYIFYRLDGSNPPDVYELAAPGYRNSAPVVTGNRVTHQHQHGVYGDILETVHGFVSAGNLIDSTSAMTLAVLADQCADTWRRPDAGIWELEERQHYTMSKISAWQALARAVELADAGHIASACRERWARERDRIAIWIDEHCWSEHKQAYVMYPGSNSLDASLALALPFRFNISERLRKTVAAIDRELRAGAFHYRYSDVIGHEGCFLACTFWLASAWYLLDEHDKAHHTMQTALDALGDGPGTLAEMIDPHSGAFLGNFPQGLSHLAVVHAVLTLAGKELPGDAWHHAS